MGRPGSGVRGVASEARVKRYLAMGLGNIRASSFGFSWGLLVRHEVGRWHEYQPYKSTHLSLFRINFPSISWRDREHFNLLESLHHQLFFKVVERHEDRSKA